MPIVFLLLRLRLPMREDDSLHTSGSQLTPGKIYNE